MTAMAGPMGVWDMSSLTGRQAIWMEDWRR